MKNVHKTQLMLILFFLTSSLASAQISNIYAPEKPTDELKTYLIEREIPNAGDLTDEQLKVISQQSNAVLEKLGPDIQWMHSYVTDNKVFCVYRARNKELIQKHSESSGFPANSILELSAKIEPDTGGE